MTALARHLPGRRTSGPVATLLTGAVLVLTACSTSTDGTGTHQGSTQASTPPASSSTGGSGGGTDFPSGSLGIGGGPATGGAGSPTTSAPAPSSSTATTKPVPQTPLRSVTVQGEHGTYTIDIWAEVRSATCPDHAYGAPVISYLTKHKCTGLTRILATSTVGGKAVGFAQSSLGFTGTEPDVYANAGGFTKLVTKDGTGNLDDLFRDGYRLPSGPDHVPSPDAFAALNQDNGVTIDDVFYLGGSTPENAPALVQFAQDIYLQF